MDMAGESESGLGPDDARNFNLPKTENAFLNSRGQILHYRVYLPSNENQVESLIIFFHGHGAHINSPAPVRFGQGLVREINCGVVMLDLVGHGWSEGERAYVEDYNHLVQDAVEFIRHVRSEDVCEKSLWQRGAARARWFAAGQSLGGAVALLAGRRLRGEWDQLQELGNKPHIMENERSAWGGVLLFAPAIRANPPPAAVIFIFQYILLPLFPKQCLPSAIYPNRGEDLTWVGEQDQRRARADRWGEPGGLRWGHNMRLGTAYALMQMLGSLGTELQSVDFPFLALHDPEDQIVQCAATRELAEAAATPEQDRRFVELPGARHDLICNATDIVIENVKSWIEDQKNKTCV